jgi:hypothetical protein
VLKKTARESNKRGEYDEIYTPTATANLTANERAQAQVIDAAVRIGMTRFG